MNTATEDNAMDENVNESTPQSESASDEASAPANGDDIKPGLDDGGDE